MNGWIKLHRQIEEWEWYTDVNTCHLFLHLLFKVNHEPKHWRGITIETGQHVTSLVRLSGGTGLSVQQVRTALEHLKSTGDITCKPTNKFTFITVNNYGKYQSRENANTEINTPDNTPFNTPDNNKQEEKKIRRKEMNIYMSENGLEKFIEWLNEKQIFPNKKAASEKACSKWSARRKSFEYEKIQSAFENLQNEPDRWKIKNNGHRPLAWWLHSDERIEEMLNCHLKQGKRGVALISNSYGQ